MASETVSSIYAVASDAPAESRALASSAALFCAFASLLCTWRLIWPHKSISQVAVA